MDKISIPDSQVVPMEEIVSDVRGLRIAFVNVFMVTHADGSWTLIDASLPMTSGAIRRWAEKFAKTPPNAILLTHGHFDHVGAARDLADHWDVPVYAHSLEEPYLTGKQEYPAPNPGAGGGLMSLLSPVYPRGPIDLSSRLRFYPPSSPTGLPQMPGWQVLHTPGHTPGHVSFYRPSDRCLLAGDAFCTTKPESFFEAAIAQSPELHGPPSYFTSDWDAARESVELLATLEPLTVAPGHGQAIRGTRVPDELRQLARQFDAVAIPENKRDAAA